MKLTIYIGRKGSLNFVEIEGLEKSKKNEQMATDILCKILQKKMLTRITLNNWKGSVLQIRYATNKKELSDLLVAIKNDADLPMNHEEHSLLMY